MKWPLNKMKFPSTPFRSFLRSTWPILVLAYLGWHLENAGEFSQRFLVLPLIKGQRVRRAKPSSHPIPEPYVMSYIYSNTSDDAPPSVRSQWQIIPQRARVALSNFDVQFSARLSPPPCPAGAIHSETCRELALAASGLRSW